MKLPGTLPHKGARVATVTRQDENLSASIESFSGSHKCDLPGIRRPLRIGKPWQRSSQLQPLTPIRFAPPKGKIRIALVQNPLVCRTKEHRVVLRQSGKRNEPARLLIVAHNVSFRVQLRSKNPLTVMA